MPSYRFTATVGMLRPGVSAAAVLPTLADDARTLAVVEASSVNVVAGRARLVIRFTGEDDADAVSTAEGIAGFALELVELQEIGLTRRVKQAWIDVSPDPRARTP
jgi:hypothetical protein